jgi:FMN reductase
MTTSTGGAPRIVVVSAGLGTPSSTRLLADDLSTVLRETHGARIELIEVRPLAHQITDNLLTGFPAPELREALDAVVSADGLVVVTPVFAASFSGLFKSFFDVVDKDALTGMPVLIAATGGTERHSLALEHALRPLFGYLRAHVVPTAVFAASSDFGGQAGDSQALAGRVRRAAGELATLVAALGPRTAPDPFADAPDFAALLDDASQR